MARLLRAAADAYTRDERARQLVAARLEEGLQGGSWNLCEYVLAFARSVGDPALAVALATRFAEIADFAPPAPGAPARLPSLLALSVDLAALMVASGAGPDADLLALAARREAAQVLLIEYAAAGGSVGLASLSESDQPLIRALAAIALVGRGGAFDASKLAEALRGQRLSRELEQRLMSLALRSLAPEQAVLLIRDRAVTLATTPTDMLSVVSALRRSPDGAARARAILDATISALVQAESTIERAHLCAVAFALHDVEASPATIERVARYLSTAPPDPTDVQEATARANLVPVLTGRCSDDQVWDLARDAAQRGDFGVVTGALSAFGGQRSVGFFAREPRRSQFVALATRILADPPARHWALLQHLLAAAIRHDVRELRPGFERLLDDLQEQAIVPELRQRLDAWGYGSG